MAESGSRVTSSVRTVLSRAALYHIAIRQYDLLETQSALIFVCMWWAGNEHMGWGHHIYVAVAPENGDESQRIPWVASRFNWGHEHPTTTRPSIEARDNPALRRISTDSCANSSRSCYGGDFGPTVQS